MEISCIIIGLLSPWEVKDLSRVSKRLREASLPSLSSVAEESFQYDVRVVSDAIQRARNKGAAIHTIRLLGFNLPYYDSWEVPDLSTLSESLRDLLDSVQVLRLARSKSPLELLSHCALDLYQLDMCHMVAKHNALEDFLEKNRKSIRSIGFHDVTITGSSRLDTKFPELSSNMLCEMLKV